MGSTLQGDFRENQSNGMHHSGPCILQSTRKYSSNVIAVSVALLQYLYMTCNQSITRANLGNWIWSYGIGIIGSLVFFGEAQRLHSWQAYACVLGPSVTTPSNKEAPTYGPAMSINDVFRSAKICYQFGL